MSLARAITSSSSSKESTVITGPKISSRTMAMSSRAAVEHGRRDEGALGERAALDPLSAGEQLAPSASAPVDIGEHLLHVLLARSARRHGSAGSSGSPTTMRATRAASFSRKAARTRALDEDAGAVRADLAGRVEVGQQRARHRIVEVGVVEDDQRRLAAELERHVLERLRRVRHHRLAGADLAGERHLARWPDGGSRGAPVSAKPWTTLKTPSGRPASAEDLGELGAR